MISGRKSMLSNWSCLNWSIAEQTARGGSTVGLCRCVCAQLCLYEPTDCSLPGSSVHGIPQARILEWVAISVFRGSSWPRDPTHVSCISLIIVGLFTRWATGTNDVIFQQTVGLEDTWLERTEMGSSNPLPFAFLTQKNPPVKKETRVQSLGREDPLEKEMATNSIIFAWEIPRTEKPGGL